MIYTTIAAFYKNLATIHQQWIALQKSGTLVIIIGQGQSFSTFSWREINVILNILTI
jgi:hypothetical protein